ncbi:MAG: delta-60 repeat domain-containing protein, partial [Chthoniobacterales bacterium]|nr:delta-60 repeat domain-containing protein [Chthoniobacterales bacterium]
MVGGFFSLFNGQSRKGILRLNPNGSLDTTFKKFSSLTSAHVIAFQPDGKILIGGNFTLILDDNHFEAINIARLNSDGSIDTEFNPQGGFDGVVNAIAIQNDGKILVGGQFSSFNDISKNAIARLHPNGTLDDTFEPNFIFISGG